MYGTSEPDHVIRLREPWTVGLAASGSRVYIRRFGLPTNLTEFDRVFLVIGHCTGEGQVVLNDHPIGQVSPGQETRLPVTGALEFRNEVRVELTSEAEIAEIRLEIFEQVVEE